MLCLNCGRKFQLWSEGEPDICLVCGSTEYA